jgi:hypothetical protein
MAWYLEIVPPSSSSSIRLTATENEALSDTSSVGFGSSDNLSVDMSGDKNNEDFKDSEGKI